MEIWRASFGEFALVAFLVFFHGEHIRHSSAVDLWSGVLLCFDLHDPKTELLEDWSKKTN